MRLRNWIFYERIVTKRSSAALTVSHRKLGLVLLDSKAPIPELNLCTFKPFSILVWRAELTFVVYQRKGNDHWVNQICRYPLVENSWRATNNIFFLYHLWSATEQNTTTGWHGNIYLIIWKLEHPVWNREIPLVDYIIHNDSERI